MELNYQAIINALQYQANALIAKTNSDLVVNFVNEQAFDRRRLQSKEMLVIVRFGAASVFQGKIDLALYFDIIGLPNDVQHTQEFFTKYAIEYNNTTNNDVLQYYNTPNVSTRFNDYGYETRAFLTMRGALVITLTDGITDVQVFNENTQEYESIKFLSEDLTINFTPLPEPTGESNGENITTNQAKTITFAFTTYFENNYFVQNVLQTALDKNSSFNRRFLMRIIFEDVITTEREFVVSNVSLKREIAATSVLNIVMVV